MRILLVHPGASMSTADVCTGLSRALTAQDHEIFDFSLDVRIERSGAWLMYCWRKGGKQVSEPTNADILYHAGEELVARALRVQPDVVLVVSAMYLHPDIFVLMHRARLNVAVLFTESPYDDERQVRLLPFVSLAWTNERTSAKDGVRYMPHAWDEGVHSIASNESVKAELHDHDVVFVGTGFEERIELLSKVEWDGIDLGLYGSWDMLGSRSHLRKHIKGGYVDNVVTAELYRRAKIGLNLYRTSKGFGKKTPKIVSAESLNPRAYELAATGCFTVSDHRAEVGEVFGGLVPTFSRPEEVRPLIDSWLLDDAGRARVREALPKTVAAHTWNQRAQQVIRDLRDVGIVASRAVPSTAAKQAAVGGSAT